MLLRRFTDNRSLAAGLLAMLVLAGCGGPGPVRDESRPDVPVGRDATAGGEVAMPEAPPQVLTLFEQATAVMAAGDFVDAADKKELVAQYKADASARTTAAAEQPGAVDNLVNIIPENPVRAATSGEMLQIIFFAIFFGVALTLLPEDCAPGAGESWVKGTTKGSSL